MWSNYPITGSTTTFMHFECVIRFIMPFTTVVTNGRIMTSLIVQILPFTPLGSYSGVFRPFTVFFSEITVLRCTWFKICPVCCKSFSVIVTIKWSMTWVPICTGTLYMLFMVLKCPHPLKVEHTLYQIPQWKDCQPHFCTESLTEGRDLGPSIHQCHCLHSLYYNHSLIGVAK